MSRRVGEGRETQARSSQDHKVRDIEPAPAGRLEIETAEKEMPGLMVTWAKYSKEKPLDGVCISGSLHMTIQTAVLIETLQELGADVRWASCNIFSTQDQAATACVAEGTPVFAWKGESLEEHWLCTKQGLTWPDGGDATLLIDRGFRAEEDASILDEATSSREMTVVNQLLRETLNQNPDLWHSMVSERRGVSKETTTGVNAGKTALVCGYGDVGHSIFPLAEGRLENLGCATGHSCFVMSNSFTNQTLAQIDLWKNRREPGVYLPPRELDEEVARLHLDRTQAHLTKLSKDQADYIGVSPSGPFEPEHYKY